MRFVRLAVEAQGRTLNVSFHPHLTVVTGVGSKTRESMIQELLGGLGSHRSGTHLELVSDSGRALTIFRPNEGPHRVVESATGKDVSDEFTTANGDVDLLATFGLDAVSARRLSRIGPNDLVASGQSQQLIGRLGRIDQKQLWSDAQRVQIARQAVDDQAPETEVEDHDLTARIDKNYHAHDAALGQADRSRLLAIGVGIASIAASGVAVTISNTLAILLLCVAALATIIAFVFRARVAYYNKQLKDALGESGSDSYLSYQLDRIDGYVNSEHQRRHHAAVQADLDDALNRWHTTAGDVTVEWALENRAAIEASAAYASGKAAANQGASDSIVASRAPGEAAELVESLLARLAKARHLGQNDESFPIILDEPFGTMGPDVRPALLQTLADQDGSPQVILLTNSDDIVAWARVEELTGAMSLIGPGESTSSDTADEQPEQSPS